MIYSHKCDCNQRQTGRIFPGFEKESSLRRGGRDGSIATTELGDGVLPFQPGWHDICRRCRVILGHTVVQQMNSTGVSHWSLDFSYPFPSTSTKPLPEGNLRGDYEKSFVTVKRGKSLAGWCCVQDQTFTLCGHVWFPMEFCRWNVWPAPYQLNSCVSWVYIWNSYGTCVFFCWNQDPPVSQNCAICT